MSINNNNNDDDRLTAFDPGQPGQAGTRRNIHPLTPIWIIVLPLSSFSICNGPWHPLYSTYVLDSPHVPMSIKWIINSQTGPRHLPEESDKES